MPISPPTPAFKRVAIIGKYQAPGSKDVVTGLANFVARQGADVILEQETARNTGLTEGEHGSLEFIGQTCDLALVVGGDGTFLGAGRQLAKYQVPLVGINQGRLGFITDVALEHYQQILPPLLHGQYQIDDRALLHGEVWREGQCVYATTALNEVVVNRGNWASMIELQVKVDGHFVANHRADGLIVATPTGSTAYALSAGGPLMDPAIGGWLMLPLAPHALSSRPIVLPDRGEVSMEILSGKDASAHFDMQSLTSLMVHDCIVVRKSPHRLRLLHPVGWSYFDTLRHKLHWNERG